MNTERDFYCTYAAKVPAIPGKVFDREYRGEMDIKASSPEAAAGKVRLKIQLDNPADEILWIECKEF